MKERLDTALRNIIIIYGVICIYALTIAVLGFPFEIMLFDKIIVVNLPSYRLIDILTFTVYSADGRSFTDGYQWIILASMIVTRYVLFGKTYQR